jgi:hypothetical protein
MKFKIVNLVARNIKYNVFAISQCNNSSDKSPQLHDAQINIEYQHYINNAEDKPQKVSKNKRVTNVINVPYLVSVYRDMTTQNSIRIY